jgi:two-component system chemotaxis response regulator CheY
MKILFVEDSAVLRKSMIKTATQSGYETVEAENGVEALARLRKYGTSIDLIIMDWNMPVMDGYETLVKIKGQEEYASIPVLMATADGLEEDVAKAVKAGAAGYLIKPFSPEDLVDKIKSLTQKDFSH